MVSQPSSVSLRQDVQVSLEYPPHTTISSMVWSYLLAGRSGSVQCWPVEGTNTSTDLPTLLDGEPPDIIKPKHNILINQLICHLLICYNTITCYHTNNVRLSRQDDQKICLFKTFNRLDDTTTTVLTLWMTPLLAITSDRTMSFIKYIKINCKIIFSEFKSQEFGQDWSHCGDQGPGPIQS